jgi:hypothetical protein
MTEAQNNEDLERVQVHNLAAAVLLEGAPAAPAGRAALTLIPGAGAALQQMLLALREACSWPNMTCRPSAATRSTLPPGPRPDSQW